MVSEVNNRDENTSRVNFFILFSVVFNLLGSFHQGKRAFFFLFSLRMDAGMGGSKHAFRYSYSYLLSFFLLAVKNENGTDRFN